MKYHPAQKFTTMAASFRASLAFALAASCLVTADMQAAVLAYDGFNYNPGAVSDNTSGNTAVQSTGTGWNGGTGFAGGSEWTIGTEDAARVATATAVATGLTFSENFLASSGGAVQLSQGGGSGVYGAFQRQLGMNLTSQPEVWVSYLWSVSSNTSNTAIFFYGHQADGKYDLNSTNNVITVPAGSEYEAILSPDASAAAGLQPGTVAYAPPGQYGGTTGLTLNNNTTYLSLGRLTNNGAESTTLDHWILTSAQWDAAVAAAAGGAITNAILNSNSTYSGTSTNAAGFTLAGTEYAQFAFHRISTTTIDELRYTDSANALVVPEPGSGALLLGACGVLLVIRRRNRK